MEHVKTVLRHYDLQTGKLTREIKLPGAGNVVSKHADRRSTHVIYKYMSFNDPGSIYTYDLDSGESKLWL